MPHRSPCSDISLILGNKRHLDVAELAADITAEDEVCDRDVENYEQCEIQYCQRDGHEQE